MRDEPKLERFLRRREVVRLIGMSQSTMYAMMDRGEFPRGVKLTSKLRGWRESDVLAWQQARLAA